MTDTERGDAAAMTPLAERKPPRRTSPALARIRQTPNGPVRLTPTEVQILSFLGRHEGHPCSDRRRNRPQREDRRPPALQDAQEPDRDLRGRPLRERGAARQRLPPHTLGAV